MNCFVPGGDYLVMILKMQQQKTFQGRMRSILVTAAAGRRFLCYIQVHKDKVADTSSHYEQMKNFVGAEIAVSVIKKGQFQSVNYAADRVNNAAGQQPEKSAVRQSIP